MQQIWLDQLEKLGPDGDPAQVIALLTRVASLPRPTSAVRIVRFLHAPKAQVVAAATRTLAVLLTPLTPTQLMNLLRHREPAWPSQVRVDPLGWLGRLEQLPEATLALGIVCTHPSGWVREPAVAKLAARGDVAALRYVLPRLLDWVPAVAERARLAARAWLVPQNASAWLDHLPLWLELQRRATQACEPIAPDPRPMLLGEEARPALVAALDHPVLEVRWAAHRLARGVLPLATMVAAGLADVDPRAQVHALELSWKLADRDEALRFAHLGLTAGRGGRVRATALRRYVSLGAVPPADAVRAGLLDEGREARLMCQHLAAGAGIVNVAEHYRQLVATASPKWSRRAIVGLGEVGGPGDVPLFDSLVESPSPGIRRAALEALAQRAGALRRGTFLRALSDVSPGVSATARRALATLGVGAAEVPILGAILIETHAPRYARQSAVMLLGQSRVGTALVVLLRALGMDDTALAAEVRATVPGLLPRLAGRLMPADADALELLLTELPAKERLVAATRLALWPQLRAP